MKFVVILALIGAALAAPSIERSTRIVGGENALPGEFPFIVSLQWVILTLSSHVCGGLIIHQDWILTAAHCLTEVPALGRIDVHVGRHNLNVATEGHVVHTIDRPASIIHPDWNAGNVGPDDLALLRLVNPITFNERARRVRLPVPDHIPTGLATLSGWGATGTGIGAGASPILQKLTKPLISIIECRDAINALNLPGELVDYTNVCTGPLTGGVSACSGDSGGPLVQGAAPNEVVVGVVSWGITPCGSVGAPTGVYKRVSAYNDWIQTHTGVTHLD